MAVRGRAEKVTSPADAAAATGPKMRTGAWGDGVIMSLRNVEGRAGPERPIPVAVPRDEAGLSDMVTPLKPAPNKVFMPGCLNLETPPAAFCATSVGTSTGYPEMLAMGMPASIKYCRNLSLTNWLPLSSYWCTCSWNCS